MALTNQSTNIWGKWGPIVQDNNPIPPEGSHTGQDSGGVDWTNLGIKTGLGVLGNVLNARAHNQPEEWRQKIIESEINRRNMMQGIVAPTWAGMLGYKTPEAAARIQSQVTNGGSGGPTGSYTAGTQPSKLSGILGGGGSALGLAGQVIPKLGGPVGMGISAGLLGAGAIASQVGKGRRTANGFVQGTENSFGNDLAQVVNMMKTDPNGAKALFQQKYGNYQAMLNQERAAGGNRATVAQQSSTNPKLQQTIQSIAQQLGVQL